MIEEDNIICTVDFRGGGPSTVNSIYEVTPKPTVSITALLKYLDKRYNFWMPYKDTSQFRTPDVFCRWYIHYKDRNKKPPTFRIAVSSRFSENYLDIK